VPLIHINVTCKSNANHATTRGAKLPRSPNARWTIAIRQKMSTWQSTKHYLTEVC